MNEIQQLLSQADPLKIKIELFKRKNFDFIVKGIANNSEGDWEKGHLATHKKQEEALKTLTSNKYDIFLYGGAAGGAKGLSINELVLTPFGFKEIGKLKVGANICATDGTVQQIIKKYDNGKIPFYRLTFADGTKLDCDYSHLWLAWKNRKSRKINNDRTFGEVSARKYTTESMYEDFVKNGTVYSIPLTEPVKFNVAGSLYGAGNFVKRDLDPYTLGVLLGDGCITQSSINFYSPDKEIADKIRKIYPELNFAEKNIGSEIHQGLYSFVGNDNKFIREYLKTVKLYGTKSDTKFIPKIYLHGTVEERWELLRGLMDTDGYADPDGDAHYSTASKQLCEDIKYLARSLGCFVTETKDKNPFYTKDEERVYCKLSYRLRIKCKTPEKLFYVKRKKDRVKDKVHQHYGNRIVNIEKIQDKHSICITVSNPNSLFITKNFIVTHNSFTGMSWIIFSALAYPNTRYFIARNELKDIRDSVITTFYEVVDHFGIKDFKYNAVNNTIDFPNRSHINLIEVKYKPSDPDYKDVGSTLYTSGWFEEVGEINQKAVSVLQTRVNRWMVDKYNLTGIVFMTGNPSKNWTKTEFYDKDKNGQLLIENNDPNDFNKKYLGCLVTENPFISEKYIRSLRNQAKNDRAIYERLFKGNWEYDDNPYQLPDQEAIEHIFDNDHVPEGNTYLTCDVARYGSDKAVIVVWRGWVAVKIITFDLSSLVDIAHAIKYCMHEYRIPPNRCIADGDGVGGGVIDMTKIKAFKNNGRPLKENNDTPNYKNLQVQCLYKLAEQINDGAIWVNADITRKQKEEIKQEFAQIQSTPNKKADNKLDCKSKGDIKSDIGRSPDYRDAFLMRCYFDLKPQRRSLVMARKRGVI